MGLRAYFQCHTVISAQQLILYSSQPKRKVGKSQVGDMVDVAQLPMRNPSVDIAFRMIEYETQCLPKWQRVVCAQV